MREQTITSFNNPENFVEVTLRLAEMYPKRNFKIDTVYFDYGQNWLHDTILSSSKETGDSYQVLCPRDWKLIDNGEIDLAIENIVKQQHNLLSK